MTETRDDSGTAANVSTEVHIAERQEVGLDHCQSRMVYNTLRKPVGRSHDGAHSHSTMQKLLQDTSTCATSTAYQKDYLLH